jgi:PAS domain-containing protein
MWCGALRLGALYVLVSRPRLARWGATDEEAVKRCRSIAGLLASRLESAPPPTAEDHVLPDAEPDIRSEHSVSELDREEVIRALQARERLLTDILGGLGSFFTIDAHWRCTFANEAGAALVGVGAEELLGRDVREFLLEDAREQVCAQLDVAISERRVVHLRSRDSGLGPAHARGDRSSPRRRGARHLRPRRHATGDGRGRRRRGRAALERAERVGAELEILSTQDDGTVVTLDWRAAAG